MWNDSDEGFDLINANKDLPWFNTKKSILAKYQRVINWFYQQKWWFINTESATYNRTFDNLTEDLPFPPELFPWEDTSIVPHVTISQVQLIWVN